MRALELLADGTLGLNEYACFQAAAAAATDAVRLAVTAAQAVSPTLPRFEVVLELATAWRRGAIGADVRIRRRVISALVHGVLVRKDADGGWRVDIAWTPLGAALSQLTGGAE
jgi:hypothetical protein